MYLVCCTCDTVTKQRYTCDSTPVTLSPNKATPGALSLTANKHQTCDVDCDILLLVAIINTMNPCKCRIFYQHTDENANLPKIIHDITLVTSILCSTLCPSGMDYFCSSKAIPVIFKPISILCINPTNDYKIVEIVVEVKLNIRPQVHCSRQVSQTALKIK